MAPCIKISEKKRGGGWGLTALTVSSWETTEADALVGVQLGVALAAVVAGLLGTRVLLEGGYIAGAQDVVFLEDRGTHQDDLGAGETAGWSEIHHNWNCSIVSTSLCRHGLFKRCGYSSCLNKKKKKFYRLKGGSTSFPISAWTALILKHAVHIVPWEC